MHFYNENDPKAAAWLRELIGDGLIPDGVVDERSIVDLVPADLGGYVQCHFFAGIGGWSKALRLADWPEDRPCWTGSCPCPPFSCAGKKKLCPKCGGKPIPHPLKTGIFACVECGHEWFADGRHLWPEFLRLISERQPPVVFGEQVSGADGQIWLAGVRATLEAVGYGVGAIDTCSAGVGAPNIRQRLYWMAYSGRRSRCEKRTETCPREFGINGGGCDVRLADADGGKSGDGSVQRGGEHGLVEKDGGSNLGLEHPSGHGRIERGAESSGGCATSGCGTSGMGNACGPGLPERISDGRVQREALGAQTGQAVERGGNHGLPATDRHTPAHSRQDFTNFWSNTRTILCADGKTRRVPVEPELQSVADGLSDFLGTDWLQGIAQDEGQVRILQGCATKIAGGMLSMFPLCQTVPGRVGLLRGAGNAINVYVAAEFITAAEESLNALR